MTLYVSVAQHSISPLADSTVAPGDQIDLDPAVAAPYLDSGDLVLAPIPPSPIIAKTPKETIQ